MMPGTYNFSVFRTWVRAYECTSFVRMCVRTYVHTYVRDPVRLGLRHLYQVEFCSFIVRYPTAGASFYCISNIMPPFVSERTEYSLRNAADISVLSRRTEIYSRSLFPLPLTTGISCLCQ